MDEITIDVERLRDDLKNESLGAFFGGGFGGALIESFDIENASHDELVEMVHKQGIDLGKYEIKE